MNKTHGLHFEKFDLHVHTPASDDYKEKKVTANEVVERAIEVGLKGIAITDHQTGDFIDEIKNAAKDKNITIFPGVELYVSGGKEGIHVICLFDIDKDKAHVNQFLNTLEIYDKGGKKTIIVDKTVGQIADKLMKYDTSAIMILAHSHSSKGVLSDMHGEQRSIIFDPKRVCVLGAEANNSDFLNTDKAKTKTRVFDLLNGADANYHNRKMGVYQSSDAHTLKEIGSTYTLFKIDNPVCIGDIRQALIDRDTRIRQASEFIANVYPRILNLSITGGFLDGQNLSFHDGLNSILGGKGSGKSLVIEYLRFALNQEPNHPDLKSDHDAKLRECLKTHGTIKITLVDETEKEFEVTRTYKPSEDSPIEIRDIPDSNNVSFPIEQVFPVLFLSQIEIVKIAEDTSGKYQRNFIDQFFDFHKYQSRIAFLNNSLKDIDRSLADSFRSHLQVGLISKQISSLTQEIDKINRQTKNPLFNEYSAKQKIGFSITRQIDYLKEKLEYFKKVNQYYIDITVPEENDPEIAKIPTIKRCMDISSNAIKDIQSNLSNINDIIIKKIGELNAEYNEWSVGFADIKTKYEELIQQAGGSQIALNEKRKSYQSKLVELDNNLTRQKVQSDKLKIRGDSRKEILDDLEETRKEYFYERQKRCRLFTEQSKGALQVTIKASLDTSEFYNNLIRLKRGTYLKDEDMEILTSKISPNDFVKAVLKYEFKLRADITMIQAISELTKISIENLHKLFNHLLDENDLEDVLAIIYSSIPEDMPSIKYNVGDNFKALNELSVGQKATALLLMALSEGNRPIIIDQPEDSLDLRSIWNDVCMNLRDSKENRQFIFTTHNSSVAVASDTDKFTILVADAMRGEVLYTGSINSLTIKKEVIDYLEGGIDTYQHKRKKYNIN